ncbi:MAG: OsmC family protein [Chloroflexota bacterium]|nr:MAG: hypothetical protein DIU68_14085 [Chloroflexota bacterium]
MRNVKVRLDGSYQTTIATRNHVWVADEPVDSGGSDVGPTPMEMLLGALGACAAITARMYAQRKGWPLEGVEIDVTIEKFKKDEYPAYSGESDVVNELRQRMVFHGPLTDEQRERLLEIAGRCPVHRVLTQPNFMIEELLTDEPASASTAQ